MHMTNKKPTAPGWYWFIRAGGPPNHLTFVRVKKHGRGLTCTTDIDCSDSFCDWTAMSQMSPEHLYSNIPIPTPVIP